MKCINIISIAGLGLLMIGFGGCSKENAYKATIVFKNSTGEPVAQVGKALIDQNYLELQIPNDLVGEFNANIEQKKAMVDKQIKQEILVQEALNRGYLNKPEVQNEIKQLLIRKMSQDEWEKLKISIRNTEEELLAYYKEHESIYNKPAKIKAAYIYVPFENDKKNALKTAKLVHKKTTSVKKSNLRGEFAELITVYSKPLPNGEIINAVKPFEYQTKEEHAQKLGQKIADALWTMEDGKEISPLIEGETGYFILYKQKKKDAIVKSFESQKQLIDRKLVSEKKRRAFEGVVNDLKKNYSVKVYDDHLSKLVLTTGRKMDGLGF